MYKYAAAPTTDRERGEKEREREGGKGSTKEGRGAMSVESITHCERMTRRKPMVGVNDANISIRWILRAH